jgi:hypothetical protein
MEFNPEKDLVIDVANLTSEFRDFPVIFYRYCLKKAEAEKTVDLAKGKIKELRATTRKRIKADVSVKHTENSLEADIDTDLVVIEAQKRLAQAEHDAATIAGAVESMRAKKDCLIQLGSDRRKEI